MVEWKKLQNGSDIRGYAVETPDAPVNLTDEVVEALAGGFGWWLAQKLNRKPSELRVAIGRDSRISGPNVVAAAMQGLSGLGIEIYSCGLASTPAMFMSTVTSGYEYDGSIMVTASHLPFNRNGLKFFTAQGGLESSDIKEILALAADYGRGNLHGQVHTVDFMSVYAAGLVEKVRAATGKERPLEGFHVVVDAGNGAGGFYVTKVLDPLGANTEGSQFLDPDGLFPNHIPNPEDETAMASISKAVLDNHADLGIIFDTDGDRAGAVDSTGRELNRNLLIALMSAILLEEHPGTAIVTDSITSTGLAAFIKAHGGRHHRFKRGYRNVINESVRLNKAGEDSQLAMETSGHGALKENYFLDDGAYLVTKILIKMAQLAAEGRLIGDLISDLAEPAESREFRMPIRVPEFAAFGTKLIADLSAYAATQPGWTIAPDNHEGIRVSFDAEHGDGWFLLRLSLHDPLIPLNIESDRKGGVLRIAKALAAFLAGYEDLDSAVLQSFVAD